MIDFLFLKNIDLKIFYLGAKIADYLTSGFRALRRTIHEGLPFIFGRI
jgi:hypothetical protein